MKMVVGLLTALGIIVPALSTAAVAQEAEVSVGIASASSDAPIFIAEKKGYFRAEGLKVKPVMFSSATYMVAPLGAGQLDVGGGAPSAGLYNAVARGIKLKIVADKGSSQPGYWVNQILVRKDLVDSGRYKTPKDLKGMKLALAGTGVSSMTTLNETIRPFGVKYSEVQIVDLAFPQHVVALRNKAIDASITTDPSATVAIQEGIAVSIKTDDEVIPRHQIAVLLYSEDFALRRPEVAKRFMRAYLKAVRFYNDALKGGRFAGPNADEVVAILTEATPIKDAAVHRAITPNGCDPNGRVDVPSLKQDLDFYREQGLINGAVSVDQVLDPSFAQAALNELGPYRPGMASR
jgi:NitT/TauT family transport system substrate-binding protein